MKTRLFELSATDQRILINLVKEEIEVIKKEVLPSFHILDRLERLERSLKLPMGHTEPKKEMSDEKLKVTYGVMLHSDNGRELLDE